MKPLKIIPLLFFILLLSCDTNSIKNQEKKNDINYDEKGIIPRDHTFYDAKGYDELLATYKLSLKQDKGKHYFHNLRNYCIFKLFATDIFKSSTQKERLFIANELVDLKYATPNIENFYALIMFQLENDEIDIDKAKSLAKTFEAKNKRNIKSIYRSKPQQKREKLNEIDDGRTAVLGFERKQRLLRMRKEFGSDE